MAKRGMGGKRPVCAVCHRRIVRLVSCGWWVHLMAEVDHAAVFNG